MGFQKLRITWSDNSITTLMVWWFDDYWVEAHGVLRVRFEPKDTMETMERVKYVEVIH